MKNFKELIISNEDEDIIRLLLSPIAKKFDILDMNLEVVSGKITCLYLCGKSPVKTLHEIRIYANAFIEGYNEGYNHCHEIYTK